MKWLRAVLAVPLLLMPTAPAAASDTSTPIPAWCVRDLAIRPVQMAEGTLGPGDTSPFTWFGFTVHATGCQMTGATVVYRTVPLSTEEDDLIAESGTLTWNAFDMSTRTVYYRVYKDDNRESDEEFVFKVVCEESQGISAGTYARGTILNDDGLTFSSEQLVYHYHCRQ
ncbi:hypothetical protein [Allorhizocola rhizosphaerae]|uniref:hypothetical protein n=1 Tax=Allorhizocola rhizosphaerae TaxID=1872709 RepID=UPI000E3E931C|nr:hypothetical protein [Allorhizocola rhizosphaerae]